MKIGHLIGRCLPSQIQFKRELADLLKPSESGFVTLRKLCQSLRVAEGSSKPEAAHCQNRYPSPKEWSDHTRVRPLTPFWGGVGQENASFDAGITHLRRSLVAVRETIPCDISPKVAHHVSSGVNTSGVHICSVLSKSQRSCLHRRWLRPVRAPASNAHPWVPLVALWQLPSLTPTSLAARLSAALPGQLATRLVFAPADRPRIVRHIKGRQSLHAGGLFVFARTV